MIIKDFKIEEISMQYCVGLNQIKIDPQKFLKSINHLNPEEILTHIINNIDNIQEKYENSIIQIINSEYLLNQEHVFSACYHFLKAFRRGTNISNKKNIEMLLYLAAQRQIKNAIDAFGINLNLLNMGIITYCIIGQSKEISSIDEDIQKYFNGEEHIIEINNKSWEKLEKIKKFFEINDTQLKVVSASCVNGDELENNYSALHDLINEKMTLLGLEKLRLD